MSLARHCATLVRRARTNFYWAFVFLPREKRQAIFTAYAFARQTDDLVDDATSTDAARRALAAWRDELVACYAGRPTHPITRDLAVTLERFPIPADHFEKLIEGCEMDLVRARYDTFEELREYCYCVASVIGLISIEIFGYRCDRTREYAVNLGTALQLTNIIRDVCEDARRDRIYVPREDLDRFACTEADVLTGSPHDAWRALMAFQCDRAQSFYDRAAATLPEDDRPGMFSAEIMGRIYHAILREIRNRDYDVRQRVRVSTPRKVAIATMFWLGSMRPARPTD